MTCCRPPVRPGISGLFAAGSLLNRAYCGSVAARSRSMASRFVREALAWPPGVTRPAWASNSPSGLSSIGLADQVDKAAHRLATGKPLQAVGRRPLEMCSVERARSAEAVQGNQTEHDVLVLGGIHASTERVGHLPKLGLITDIGASGLLRAVGLRFSSSTRHPRSLISPLAASTNLAHRVLRPTAARFGSNFAGAARRSRTCKSIHKRPVNACWRLGRKRRLEETMWQAGPATT